MTQTLESTDPWEAFYGPNAAYVEELYERYLDDPDSVDQSARRYFDQVRSNGNGNGRHAAAAVQAPEKSKLAAANGTAPGITSSDVSRVVLTARLARSIREYGHLEAKIDPLGAPRPGDPMLNPATHRITEADLASLPASIVFPEAGPNAGSSLDAIDELRRIYTGSIGYEFDHVDDFHERTWLHAQVENPSVHTPLSAEQKRSLLERLSEVEGFERFLHSTFVGQKRFSLEGTDMLVPMLDELIGGAAQSGTREIVIGMAHRGRLNVLAHILGKPYEAILSEFHLPGQTHEPSEGSELIHAGWTGDVKYHLGAHKTLEGEAAQVQITLADNPSHLEFVNPVVEGEARAAQDDRSQAGPPRQDVSRALAVTIHGDAAFPGEGVVAETLNLARLPGYGTGGTIHFIVNNQLGFTTLGEEGRSTIYSSDLAKGFDVPIVHVNADDPEAALEAVRLALRYRERFHGDFLIDLVGYRRWGHNEGDEPAFTQPELYRKIASHPTVRALYADHLEREGVVTKDAAEEMLRRVQQRLQEAREPGEPATPKLEGTERDGAEALLEDQKPVAANVLREINQALLERPEGVTANPKLDRVLQRRREALDKAGGVDWALAEALALGTILRDGTPIRLTGQDTERGTFSQRHLVLHDPQTGATYTPLQRLPQARASFAVYNSPLSEAAAMGFEYGYSIHALDALVLWEAQFGDFANAAQVVIDQFIVAARAKWRQEPALVLLLPHGYEGQGPEHSSARLERYLQLAAQDNVRVANVSTAAQYFHLLRLQANTLSDDRRPLVIMTPKSLLRHPQAASSLQDLADSGFEAVVDDPDASRRPEAVERLILASGKVTVDLTVARSRLPEPADWLATARVELLYPFPREAIAHLVQRYSKLREVVWLQEEPANMGAWTFMRPGLEEILPEGLPLRYIGRGRRAATAVGSPAIHEQEQSRIIEAAFTRNAAD